MSETQAPALDLAHLRHWIGRTEKADDIVTPRLAAEFRATFDPYLAPARGDDAPWMLHWCLTPPIAPTSALTDEGHIAKGGFLPPVPLPRRMWAGGEVETLGSIRIGAPVHRLSRVADVAAKDGRTGLLCFVTVHHEYRTGDTLVVRERQDIVYREAPNPSAPSPASPPVAARSTARPGQDKTPDLAWALTPTVPFLFRYSALTFNAHRIHYDLPYVTQTEGYPGLVVHGPLQASLLFNLATVIGGGPPSRFSYRGVSPLIAGGAFQVCGARDGESVRCWTQDASGRTCMEARAHRA